MDRKLGQASSEQDGEVRLGGFCKGRADSHFWVRSRTLSCSLRHQDYLQVFKGTKMF